MLVKKITTYLNIHADANQRWILISLFVSSALIAFIAPTLNKALFEALPTRWFAFSSIIGCLSGIICGIIWRGDFRGLLLRYFLDLAIAECLLGACVGFYMAFFDQNMWIYAICSVIYSNLITVVVGKCIMAFKSKLWNEREREIYDNNTSTIAYLSMLIGYILSFLFVPSLKLSLFCFGICCLIDDIGWIVVFIKNNRFLKNL